MTSYVFRDKDGPWLVIHKYASFGGDRDRVCVNFTPDVNGASSFSCCLERDVALALKATGHSEGSLEMYPARVERKVILLAKPVGHQEELDLG